MTDHFNKREITRMRLDELIVPEQVRTQLNDARDRELGESMMQHGQLQPAGCFTDRTLRWGFRRWHSAKLVGLEFLDVIISDEVLEESEIITLQLIENTQREGLSGWDVYQGCLGILQRNPGMRLKHLAKRL